MSLSEPIPTTPQPQVIVAFLALCAGAVAMGVSPVFVRLADVGPFASAFWRVALAIPALAVWALLESGPGAIRAAFACRAVWAAGFFFSIDLFFWHLAILHTSIANATFLSSMAPIWVLLFSRLFIGEVVDGKTTTGLVTCLAGGAILLGGSYSLDLHLLRLRHLFPGRARRPPHLLDRHRDADLHHRHHALPRHGGAAVRTEAAAVLAARPRHAARPRPDQP
jgi:drug/metabolite transporter (DMT)-like permease